MESVKSGWQELKTTSGPKCPKLFYNFTADQDGYTTQFTDLIGFWTAISPATDIVDYAKITRTSIDPSDSRSQLYILLQKLSQSLAEGANTLRQEDGETQAILLQTILKLPRPLQPLKWEFYLEPRGTEALAESILRPCLLEASESNKKLDSLYEVIKVKDHVISKLMEKIEGSTIDLSIIFPGITGARSRKGQTTIKDAQKHVPGLKPFSRHDWLKHFETDSPYAGFEAAGLSKLVTGCEKCPKHKSHQHEQWLRRLPKATSSVSQAAKDKMDLHNTSSDQDNTESDSDQFETQRKKIQTPEKVNKASDYSRVPSFKRDASRPKSTSPIRSSSPMLPPPPISISQPRKASLTSSTTLPSDPSDLDKTTSRPRLGRLGGNPRTPGKPQSRSHNIPSDTQTQPQPQISSPPPPRIPSPIPSSPLRSSPPPLSALSRQPTLDRRPISSSSIATLSSLNPPTTPPKRPLGRLNSLKTTSTCVSVPTTPEHKRLQSQKDNLNPSSTLNDTVQPPNQPPSTQGTPTRRRLGRIGRTASQLSRQQTQVTTRSSPIPELDENPANDSENHNGNASDASTASTTSSVSPNPKVKAAHDPDRTSTQYGRPGGALPSEATLRPPESGSLPGVEPEVRPEPEPEPEPELSKEEKAAKRREELKRKIEDSSAGGGTVGNTGLRKKRKF